MNEYMKLCENGKRMTWELTSGVCVPVLHEIVCIKILLNVLHFCTLVANVILRGQRICRQCLDSVQTVSQSRQREAGSVGIHQAHFADISSEASSESWLEASHTEEACFTRSTTRPNGSRNRVKSIPKQKRCGKCGKRWLDNAQNI